MSGILYLILGPSGSGKGTVLSLLKQRHPEFVFPVSCTTRVKRPTEVEGEVYHFISKEEFKRRIEAGEFLEWAVVHQDNYYGTMKAPIMEALAAGKTVVREVDVQGVRSIRALMPGDQCVSIFLTVPDWETLKGRILQRAVMSEEELARRHESFLKEKEWERECDHVIQSVEHQIEPMVFAVEAIISGGDQSALLWVSSRRGTGL